MTSFFYSRYLSGDIGYERVFHVSGSNSNSNLPNFRLKLGGSFFHTGNIKVSSVWLKSAEIAYGCVFYGSWVLKIILVCAKLAFSQRKLV